MTGVQYDELRLTIDARGEGVYNVRASSGGAEATAIVALPEAELDVFLAIADRPRRLRGSAPRAEAARAFGDALFRAVFVNGVHDVYRDARASTSAPERGLRVTLCLSGAPELHDVPWEYLYDDRRHFIGSSQFTPIVRYIDLPDRQSPQVVDPPINILAMVSSPDQLEPIDADREQQNLEEGLRQLMDDGSVTVTWLREPTLTGLLNAVSSGDREYHVFHYIGHGEYDPVSKTGHLKLEDGRGRVHEVSGADLAEVLGDHRSLRLAVLNACDGARIGRTDPLSGVAAALVRLQIPAVVAMQFPITDWAAITFAGGFYRAIARGLPVDAAVAHSRKAIFAGRSDGIEWGTAVLFMRVPDGRIFTVQPGPGRERRGAPPAEAPPGPATAPQPTPASRHRRAAVLAGTVAVAVAGASLAVALGGGGAGTAEASTARAHQLCGDMVQQAEESASEDRVELRQMESAVGWQRADRIVAQRAADLLNESETAGTDLAAIEKGLQGRALADATRAGSELEANATTLEEYVSKLGSEPGPVQFVRDVDSYRTDTEKRVLNNQIQAGDELNDLESCNAKQAGERTSPAPLLIPLQWSAGGAGPDRRPSQTVLAHLRLGILFANVSPTDEPIHLPANATSTRPVLSPVTPLEIESLVRGGGETAQSAARTSSGSQPSSSGTSSSGSSTASSPSSTSSSSGPASQSSSSSASGTSSTTGSGTTTPTVTASHPLVKPVVPGSGASGPPSPGTATPGQ